MWTIWLVLRLLQVMVVALLIKTADVYFGWHLSWTDALLQATLCVGTVVVLWLIVHWRR